MSKTIAGDVAIGRHVYTGGDANVAGSATIKGNVKVDGWLDAKNIKYANKGLFPTEDKLKEAYPEPKRGWYALVGETIPAPIYIVVDGEWKNSNKMSSDLEVTLTNYVTKGELQAELQAELAEVTETSNNAISIANEASAQVSAMGDQIASNQSAIAMLQSSTGQTDDKVSQLESTLSEHSLDIEIYDSRISENTESIEKHRSDVVKVVARLDAKNTEQDSEINGMKQSVQANTNSFYTIEQSLNMFKDEVETKQLNVDNKIANIETLNVTQTNWHKAHSIINLHQFVNFASFDMSVFSAYMNQVPSQLIRTGLIVLFNEVGKWQAQQLVDTDAYTEPTGYVKLDWDNSNLESTIKTIQGDVSNLYSLDEAQATILDEHGGEIGSLKASISALEGKVDALTLRLDSVDLFIREIELRLDAFNSRISALENKL